MAEISPLPMAPEGFTLVMADPPWSFTAFSDNGLKKSAQNHYDCMDLDAIKAMPVADIAAKDALLWLWATSPMLPQALEVVEAWGARYVTQGQWVKYNDKTEKMAFGTGYFLRCASEPFIIAKWGKPPVVARNIRNVIWAPRREHSRKPDEAFEAAARMTTGARVELFSRESRDGWVTWGNQSEHFDPRRNVEDFI